METESWKKKHNAYPQTNVNTHYSAMYWDQKCYNKQRRRNCPPAQSEMICSGFSLICRWVHRELWVSQWRRRSSSCKGHRETADRLVLLQYLTNCNLKYWTKSSLYLLLDNFMLSVKAHSVDVAPVQKLLLSFFNKQHAFSVQVFWRRNWDF